MQLNFAAALAALNGANAVFQIMNQARPAADRVFATILPEVNQPTYYVQRGEMTVYTTMAGASGMDSAYAKVGAVQTKAGQDQTAKITSEMTLTEQAQRTLLDYLTRMLARGGSAMTQEFMRDEALAFLNKIIVQSHLDTSEWLRGQALAFGEIDWLYNGIRLQVDYGVPAANKLAQRTLTARYGSTASMFWSDIRSIQAKLNYGVRAILIHPQLLGEAIDQAYNRIQVTSSGNGIFNLRKLINDNGQPSGDDRDTVQLIAYGGEGEVYDPADPTQTIKIPFMPKTQMVGIGNGSTGSPYVVGQGSTPIPAGALGITHMGPTVEGGNEMGRWARLFVPEQKPWQLTGQGVSNELPAIDHPEQIVIASSVLMS